MTRHEYIDIYEACIRIEHLSSRIGNIQPKILIDKIIKETQFIKAKVESEIGQQTN